jgi:hypothetical protein
MGRNYDTGQVGVAAKFQDCIREVLLLTLGRNTGYPD